MKYIKAVNHIIRNIRFLAGKVRADENNLDYFKSDREVLNSELSYFQYWLKLEDLPHDPESLEYFLKIVTSEYNRIIEELSNKKIIGSNLLKKLKSF